MDGISQRITYKWMTKDDCHLPWKTQMSRMSELAPDQYALNKLTRRDSPETSRQAANRVFPHLSNIQERVLVFIKNCPQGVTDLEISIYFEDDRSTYRTRRAELVAMGRIRNSGRTIKQAGSRRTVWEFVE